MELEIQSEKGSACSYFVTTVYVLNQLNIFQIILLLNCFLLIIKPFSSNSAKFFV